MTADDISSVSEALTQMSDLAEINLLNEEGVTELTLHDVAALREAAPDAHFDYVFDLFGKSITPAGDLSIIIFCIHALLFTHMIRSVICYNNLACAGNKHILCRTEKTVVFDKKGKS